MDKFTEVVETSFCEFDEETSTIKNVALLGRVSRNGRTYSDKSFEDASAVFEGAPCFLDHPDPKTNQKVRSYVGRFSGIHEDTSTGKMRAARFEIINKDHLPFLKSLVEKQVKRGVGLSINASGVLKNKVVERIHACSSIDLVAHPATNSGLFESEEQENETVDYEKMTLEDIKKNRPDLLESHDSTNKNLEGAKKMQESLDQLKKDNEKLVKEAEKVEHESFITEALQEAEVECPAFLEKHLYALTDKKEITEFIASLKQEATICEQDKKKRRPVSKPKDGRSVIIEGKNTVDYEDPKSVLQALYN